MALLNDELCDSVKAQNEGVLTLKTLLNPALVRPLDKATLNRLNPKPGPTLIICSVAASKKLAKDLAGDVADWQLEELKDAKKSSLSWSGLEGPIWVLRPDAMKSSKGYFELSDFAKGREAMGAWCRGNYKSLESLSIQCKGIGAEYVKGALHALVLAHYKPAHVYKTGDKKKDTQLFIKSDRVKFTPKLIKQIQAFSCSMNLSRHLTNLPGGDLHPKSFSEIAKKVLAKKKGVTVEVWNEARLEKENCGLLLGVGRAGVSAPCLVKIKYRPTGAKNKKPIAFVGKGVTFDTGGLDLKPAAGMRLMKKDMSGAGIVLGLAHYVAESQPKRAFDFYLALAENGVNETAVRPGDVLTARNGKTVEIHNTDAEGRLVMADAMDVAVTQKAANAPETLIDISTLTGAMRISLGFDVAGFFSTDEKLAGDLAKSAKNVGEPAWRMPLYENYRKDLDSTIADLSNCGTGGMGGAISAALFLKEFVGDVKWAHFDVMAFNHSHKGAVSEGGNAQSFQLLADYISRA